MKRGFLLFLAPALLLGSVGPLLAQETAESENMRFVNALRQRGDNDLALKYLERMSKSVSPTLAVELPLEIAKTRLAEAAEEADSSKKQVMLNKAREEFEQFLAKNPKHRRAGEARLEIAQVSVQQGRILLSKALSAEGGDARRAEGAKARGVLAEAGKKLQVVAKEMLAATEGLPEPKTPAEKAERLRMEEDRLAAELAVALNLFDQGLTYPRDDRSDQVMKERRALKFIEAQKALERIAGGELTSPYVWQAKAWLGRCIHENGDPKNARGRYTEIIGAERNTASAEAKRLARYFRMLALEESDDVKNRVEEIEDGSTRWLKDYPRSRNTSEGNGVRYLLAEIHLGKAAAMKAPAQAKLKEAELVKARTLLHEIEQTENEFSDRARRKKLAVINEQGGFVKKIEQLTTFEDCFIRAQFEISQIAKDQENAKTDEDREKARLSRIDNVMIALERGLAMPEVKSKRSAEIGNARAILAFYSLNTKHYRDAIKFGETFAREDAAASQAANAASYALQAYSQMIFDNEERLEKSTGDLTDENGKKIDPMKFAADLQTQRTKMMEFARYVEKVWPSENAADLARHQLGILLFREKADGEQRLKNFNEAIQSLSGVSKSYPNQAAAMFLVAVKSMGAEAEKLPLLAEPAGKPALTWRQRAMAALDSIPEQVSGDPGANKIYVQAKVFLGNELYKDKKFDQMEQLTGTVLPKLSGMSLSESKAENEKLHGEFQNQLTFLALFAKYGKADAAFTANDFAKVSAILDPLVDEVKASDNHPLKTNPVLGNAMMSMALRTYIQTGKLDRARIGIQALQKMSGDDSDGATTVLRQLLALINRQLEELHVKGDKAKLKVAIDGFTALLDDLTKNTKLTPQFILNLVQCYSSMDLHPKAIELLGKYPKPKEGDAEAEKLYKGSQLAMIRELRLNKEIKKAKPILDEVMGTREKPGWGAKNIDALKEWIGYLIADEKYAEAYGKSSGLVKQLKDKVEDNTMKGHYLDFYYDMVVSMYQFAQHSKDPAKKEKTTADAAKLIDQLEKRFMGFGNEATAKRFQDLLVQEPELKKAYDKVKMDKPAGN